MKSVISTACFSVVFLLMFSGRGKAENPESMLSLITGGKAECVITITETAMKNSGSEENKSATLLARYIEKSCGAKVKIYSETKLPKNMIPISIGQTSMASASGIDVSDIEYAGGYLVVKDNKVFLTGSTTNGIRYAVLTFLHDYFGIRWFTPTQAGEYIPKRKSITVPATLNKKVGGKLAYTLAGPYSSKATPGHIINNNSSNVKIWNHGGHSWYKWIPLEKYYKTHPEYYALINGKRSNSHLHHLCVSNPDIEGIMHSELEKIFNEGYEFVQLGQSDGFELGVCECPECGKMDNYRGDNSLEALSKNPCGRIFKLHTSLARKAAEKFPDRKLVQLIYGPTNLPDPRYTFPQNVIGEVCFWDFELDKLENIINAWKGNIEKFTVYLYWETTGYISATGILPTFSPKTFQPKIRKLNDMGICGYYFCSAFGKHWGMWGPTYYSVSRQLGDPALDCNKLVKEYCAGLYGKSGPTMESFFELLYSRIDNAKVIGDAGAVEEILFYYPPYFVRKLDSILADAEKLADTETSRNWLRLTRLQFDYMKHMSYMLASYNAWQATPDRANLVELKKYVDEFEDYRASIFALKSNEEFIKNYFIHYDFMCKYLIGLEFFKDLSSVGDNIRGRSVGYRNCRIAAPLTLDFEKLLSQKAPEKQAVIKACKTDTLPKIDGKIDDKTWKKAQLQSLQNSSGGKADAKTSVAILHSEKSLYIAFNCSEPNITDLKLTNTIHDSAVYNNDCVEVMLTPGTSFSRYMHFVFSPAEGAFFDARKGYVANPLDHLYNKLDRSWDANDLQYAYHIDSEKKTWSIEIKIPYESISDVTPDETSTWRINLGRERYAEGTQKLYLWSPSNNGGFCDTMYFGSLIFSNN